MRVKQTDKWREARRCPPSLSCFVQMYRFLFFSFFDIKSWNSMSKLNNSRFFQNPFLVSYFCCFVWWKRISFVLLCSFRLAMSVDAENVQWDSVTTSCTLWYTGQNRTFVQTSIAQNHLVIIIIEKFVVLRQQLSPPWRVLDQSHTLGNSARLVTTGWNTYLTQMSLVPLQTPDGRFES